MPLISYISCPELDSNGVIVYKRYDLDGNEISVYNDRQREDVVSEESRKLDALEINDGKA